MAQQKNHAQLDRIKFENVSFQVEGLDPVLKSVDLELPTDQTVIVQATDPSHAVQLLEILAGLKQPQSGRVIYADSDDSEDVVDENPFYEIVGSYFEFNRPSADTNISMIFNETGAAKEIIAQAAEHFEIESLLIRKFKELSFEQQKLILLIRSTLRTPQMLVLEDPAVGLSEDHFLNFLDWIQYWQRRGTLRHVYLTNNHPSAARHFEHTTMFVDDGLLYVEEPQVYKKIVNF